MNQKELAQLIYSLLKQEAPKGACYLINGYRYIELEVVCDGQDSDMGYQCVKKPGHTGQCWSMNKHVDFTRCN